MSFASPFWLLALIVVPVVVGLYLWNERRRVRSQAAFANPALLPAVVDHAPGRLRHLPLAVLLVGLVAMVLGVARPHATITVSREEATVMLAIDTSRSMRSNDVKPSRLGAAVEDAAAFIARVPKKFRIGIVQFASAARVALPPTADRALVQQSLADLKPGDGTAIGDAVSLAVKISQQQRTSDGKIPPTAVLMISDGARDGGRVAPQTAAAQAKKLHIPVYTIVLGTPGGTVTQTLTGGYQVIIHVPPSPQTLQQIAQTSGGQSFTVVSDSRLKEVYKRLGSLLGSKKEDREITDVFAGGAALLLLTGGGLSMFWFRRLP
ncbi:MAG TPA: VWA domain-containing protein [Gaiellaceae bacterium]|nr:VWA domain-containing protein [Gaiellaceae bacterium]